MKLGDVLEKIVGGGTPSKNRSEFWNGNIPWASVKDINEGQVFLSSTEDTITEEGVKNSSTNIIYKGNVILPTRMGLGRCVINTIDTAINQDLKALYPKKDKLDSKFLLYWLKNNSRLIESMGSGTTVKGIRIEQLTDMNFKKLDLYIQQRIAKVLSNYDNLIENNNKRIKILEEMAQKIYKEWFVDFNYPGHETATFKDTELGKIPIDWEVKTIEDVISDIESGSRPKGGIVQCNSGIPSIGAENIIGLGKYDYSKEKLVTNEFYNKMKKGKIKSLDVLLYKDGAQIGRKSMFGEGFPYFECCINEHVFILRTNTKCSQYYLYFTLDLPEYTEKIKQLNTNAAQPGINQQQVKGIKIRLAPISIINKFDEIVKPIISLIFNLCIRNKELMQTRDLLLPRLMSGEINVENLEIA